MAFVDIWEWFVSFFRRKRVLIANILTVDGDLVIVRRKVKESKFEWKHGVYTVRKNRVYINKKSHKSTAFYYEGNPEPIDLEHTKHPAMSAEALKEVIRSDMVKDMYATDKDNTAMIVIILLAVIGVIALINMLIAMKVIKVE